MIELFQKLDSRWEELSLLGIYNCDYKKQYEEHDDDDDDECVSCDDCCDSCQSIECELEKHIEDKDVVSHITLVESDIEFPAILVLADTYCTDETVKIISVREAKENSRYGIDY